MFLPPPIIAVLSAFQPAFTRPTYRRAVALVVGTLLARGRRTVAAALRQLGLHHRASWAAYHHVLNRSVWSPRTVSRLLLQLIVATFVGQDGMVELVIDETLERRWGRKIKHRCHWRDSRLSSRQRHVTSSGLRWVVMAVVVTLPWTPQRWALPFLSVLATTPSVSQRLQRRHKTVPRLAQQMVKLVRRWLPTVPLKLIGDTAYSVIDLGTVCRGAQVSLIAPLRLDARLFAPPPSTRAATGRPRIVGARVPDLRVVLADKQTCWQAATIPWYGGKEQTLELTTGTALWYSTGFQPLPLRWVVVRDPAGEIATRAFFSSDQAQAAATIVADFVQRWPLEVTFEESRAHLGLETQRQWSDKAIARSTPALLGLFSLTTVLGHTLYPAGDLPVATAAWYRKGHATFSDVLAAVRTALWNNFSFQTSPADPDMVLVPRSLLTTLAQAVCY